MSGQRLANLATLRTNMPEYEWVQESGAPIGRYACCYATPWAMRVMFTTDTLETHLVRGTLTAAFDLDTGDKVEP